MLLVAVLPEGILCYSKETFSFLSWEEPSKVLWSRHFPNFTTDYRSVLLNSPSECWFHTQTDKVLTHRWNMVTGEELPLPEKEPLYYLGNFLYWSPTASTPRLLVVDVREKAYQWVPLPPFDMCAAPTIQRWTTHFPTRLKYGKWTYREEEVEQPWKWEPHSSRFHKLYFGKDAWVFDSEEDSLTPEKGGEGIHFPEKISFICAGRLLLGRGTEHLYVVEVGSKKAEIIHKQLAPPIFGEFGHVRHFPRHGWTLYEKERCYVMNEELTTLRTFPWHAQSLVRHGLFTVVWVDGEEVCKQIIT